MWRRIHSALGLASLILVVLLAISGALLSVFPVVESVATQPLSNGQTVADLAGRLSEAFPGMERIEIRPSGQIVANYTDSEGQPQSVAVDPATGSTIAPESGPGAFYIWIKDFHRSFLMGDWGRIAAGIAAAAMAALSIAGLLLLVSRMGGWAKLLDRPQGTPAARLHVVLSRLALIPFLLSSLTAVYLVLTQFELVTVEATTSLAYPESAQGLPAVSPGSLSGLASVPLSDLRSLQFPFQDDSLDVFTLRTTRGLTFVDQFTGDILEDVPLNRSERVYEWIYALHTGEGLAWLGAMLGAATALVPTIAFSGLLIWWRRRRASQVRVAGNAAAAKAEIVVLVGSESGITWGFARSLHSELSASGLAVHLAEIRDFSGSYPAARQILFLTSTYGDGHAPETAQNALSLLDRQEGVPQWHFAVLGFGDRAFSKYCQFAKDIDIAMADRGWPALLPITLINRQSAQAFASWGNDLGHAIGHELKLNHQVTNPRTRKLKLVSRTDHGGDLQAPTAILRFEVSTASDASPSWLNKVLGGPSGFTPTDLLGILPPDDPVPRYYSVASGASDAEVEICVRKLNGGRCSTLLHALALGDEIDAFVRPNPDFSLPSRRKPVIMVSAGTGIAPFTGIVRDNRRKQPLHLFWGGRNSTSDYLYHDVLQEALTQNHLATLTTAFSRVEDAAHVQDRVRSEATRLADLLRKGASVMVCGGDAMAHAVRQEFDDILRTIGSSVDALKQRGLYLEDVF